ncbi:MAG TPA: DUF4153 domain-containing protein [Alphaproteobacteria bacterium]|nr:DUF4153 domain-containing protein [Alphaproteobacteria bacterium]
MEPESSKSLGVTRAAIGLVQAVALYALYHAARTKSWPATEPLIQAPLLLVSSMLPLVFLFGLGSIRRRTLSMWSAAAALLMIGLAVHDIARSAGAVVVSEWFLDEGHAFSAPSSTLWFLSAIFLFIGQSLVTAGDRDGKPIAHYPFYFDAAWKLALQLLLSGLFVGLFWLILALGNQLLKLVQITVLDTLIDRAWFSIPVTTLALSTAIHLTDVRASMIEGTRTLVLIVLSWLLPGIALIVGIFLAALPFTGLQPLWRTSHAGFILLAVASAFIVLINAIHRDGAHNGAPHRLLKATKIVAMIELAPIVALAAVAIELRVGQYGWTVGRVYAAAIAVLVGFHAAGYLASMLRRGMGPSVLERCNVLGAFVTVGIILLLSSPFGDPARIAVSSQVAALKSGKIPPDKFDFKFLRWQGERYGQDALAALAADPGTDPATKDRVLQAQRSESRGNGGTPPTEPEFAASVTVYPAGRALPKSFVAQQDKWPENAQAVEPRCLSGSSVNCEAVLVDLDGDGVDEIVLADADGTADYGYTYVFKIDDGGVWRLAGDLRLNFGCPGVRDALRAGQFSATPSPWKDFSILGRAFRIGPPLPNPTNCP